MIEAGDGLAARELFRAQRQNIDVVLLDTTLPGISGVEVLADMRRVAPEVPVILTTAYSQEKDLGGQESWAFIRKPYQLSDLVSLLRSACQGRRRRRWRRPSSTSFFPNCRGLIGGP